MAHFAKLDENNIVIDIIVVSNEVLKDENGVEIEQRGIDFCKSLDDGNWVQTSYTQSFRKNFASIGAKYDSRLDAFIPPIPYPSWTIDEIRCIPVPPVPEPTLAESGGRHTWDEDNQRWVIIED